MTRSRHIVFVNEFYHPDICASAAVLADRLPRLRRLLPNDQLTVIAGNRAWDDAKREYAAAELHEDIRIVRVNRPAVGSRDLLSRARGFMAFGGNAVKAAQTLSNVDLVIGTTAPPHGGGIARRIARALGCRYVYTVLDLYPDLVASLGRLRESSPIFRLWRWCDTKWMRNADRIVCIAEGMAERIVRTRGISASKVLAIHDGFDPNRVGLDALADSSKPNSFQKEFNPDRKIVVQYAGNMGLSHPFETIMQACARFAADDRVQFQFIGGGPQREYVRANLPKNGVLIDYQPIERLGELLSAADICLISQHEEMFDKALPYKVYGVFAAGKPTVFVGNGQSEIVRWLIESHVGLAVRQGDVDGLARALTRLLDDSEERLEMGKAARALLDRALHAEQAAKQWAELIVELIPEQKSAHQ